MHTSIDVAGGRAEGMHPHEVVHLEHDGRVLLVDAAGKGPCLPVTGRMSTDAMLRLPTRNEVDVMEIPWLEFRPTRVRFGDLTCMVIKGYPKIDWPSHWALKDDLISDNAVHPIAREAIYRSIHRLVSKVMICNDQSQVLLGKVERGHFRGFWTLPGGYMDHDEHPAVGCVRETKEELGLDIVLENNEPIVTQNIFSDEGISFVSFTYQARWNGDPKTLDVQTEEIAEVKWFDFEEAQRVAVSHFDGEALRSL